ncbi:MAG: M56 family metallopeptidase [Rhizobacter sp.]|nr:M56 family metallopeptidase [Ferruginibacter sp.]
MEQFAYSFAITMMHSIWQMALLLLFYYVAVNLFRQWPPVAKRNLLLFVLSAQVISSMLSFYFIYSTPFLDYREDIQTLLQSFSTSQNWLLQYAPLLFSLYTFGLLYKLSCAWFNWKKFNHLYKNSLLKPSVDIRLFTEAKALHFGIKKKVTVWCSHHIKSPVTFGFFKPVLLLPVALVSQLNIQQTESLIVHELTHIKNNDYLFNWFLLVTDALFFFNPFVKMAIQKIKTEREKSCDVQVVQFNYPAIDYAEALLQIAQQQSLNAVLATVAAVSKKTELLDRIRYFSDDKNISHQQSKNFSFAALFIWSFILLNIFFAGVFVRASKPLVSNEFNSIFAAGPLNEWNKSFSTDAAVEPPLPVLPATTLAAAPSTKKTVEKLSPDVTEPAAIKSSGSIAEETPALFLTPVSFAEANPEVVKEVVINEETNGVMITKVFRMTSVNGDVKMEPLWMISEVKPSDSLKLAIKKDSSVITVIPTVQ